jgi:hypothetical protein
MGAAGRFTAHRGAFAQTEKNGVGAIAQRHRGGDAAPVIAFDRHSRRMTNLDSGQGSPDAFQQTDLAFFL